MTRHHQLTEKIFAHTQQKAFLMKHFFIACAFIASSATAHATLLDFEDAAAFGGDDAAVTDSYLQSYGISLNAVVGKNERKATDATLSFEQIGGDGTDAFSFYYVGQNLSTLGNYFLKLGPGNFPGDGSRFFIMSIAYDAAVDFATGEIWDIDGPEQFEVIGYDANGTEVASVESPAGGLDGLPWTWSLDAAGGNAISSVEINKLGNGRIEGLGFDNFSYGSTAAITANVPVPAAFPLGFIGLVALLIRHRRRGTTFKATETTTE